MGIPAGCTLDSEKYEVIRELGRGGMGVVYLAEDRLLKRQVALKVLYEHLNRDSAFVERFQEEARSVSTLHHPHIVCVHGLERSGETVAIDMEYVPGKSLDKHRIASNLTAHLVAGIAGDVLSGLVTCHEIGVVHRDIKPSNILISEDGRAKITDFGLATAYASHLEATVRGNTSSGFYMGTPRYMPLRAWEGGRAEPFWDLYAFGVVLFELLSGRTAFDGDNPVAIMRQQLTQPLPRLQDISGQVSPELSALVDQLLATGSNANAGTGTRDALAALLETPEYRELNESNKSITLALPPPRRKAHALPPGTHPRWLPALAVPVVLLMVAGMFFALNGGLEPAPEPPVSISTARGLSEEALPPDAGAGAQSDEPTAPYQFMDVTAVNDDRFGQGVWMLENDRQGMTVRIIGFTPLELWWLNVSPAPEGGRHRIDGFWGASLNVDSTSVHLGNLSGYLLRDVSSGNLAVHIERTRTRDNTRSDLSLTARPRSGALDRAQFVRLLEKNATLQSLLYRELLPRRLPWATALEAMMPALPGGRAPAPFLETAITADGALDESIWKQPVYNVSGRIGELAPQTGPESARLWIRWSEEAVYLGTRVPDAGPELQFELGVMAVLDTSSTSGGRFFASLDERGRLESRYVQGGQEKPWSCDWTGGIRRDGDEATVEFRIGLLGLSEKAHPSDGRRWRLNARLTSAASDGRRPVAVWGDRELALVEHGALLVFEHRP